MDAKSRKISQTIKQRNSMKKFIGLLKTVLTKEVKISFGYSLLQFLTVIFAILLVFSLSKSYLDYKTYMEEEYKTKCIEVDVYKHYFDRDTIYMDKIK